MASTISFYCIILLIGTLSGLCASATPPRRSRPHRVPLHRPPPHSPPPHRAPFHRAPPHRPPPRRVPTRKSPPPRPPPHGPPPHRPPPPRPILSYPSPPPLTPAEADRVYSLPGAPAPLDFGMYAGMVTVNDTAGRALFYILTESTSGNPANDPLVLWLNGGPGCSSIGNGFMSELGPFYPTASGNLVVNNYPFNRVANILYLDSPAFVGFSYSNTSSDINVGDARTAADSYEFLQRWLVRFPQYRNRPFWIAGESYGGHYVPNLALQIVQGNAAGIRPKINLQGIFLGNPWTVSAYDDTGAVEFWYTHGIISDSSYNGMNTYCDFSVASPIAARNARTQYDSGLCTNYYYQALGEMANMNIYDMYVDVCLPQGMVTEARHMAKVVSTSLAKKQGLAVNLTVDAKQARAAQPPYDPCIDTSVATYLNRPDVQRALHVNASGTLPGPWASCTPLAYSGTDVSASMIPVYEQLLAAGNLNMLIYSGDFDAIVPLLGTRRWVASLNLTITDPFRAWYSTTHQIGGWTVGYTQNFRFATVRGAGHMVPYFQAERALYLFSNWIQNKAP